MKPVAIVGAVFGAMVGAAIWVDIAWWFPDAELGWVAWPTGGLVGFAAARLGGKGAAMGTVGAILTLLSVLGGTYAEEAIHLDRKLRQQEPELRSWYGVLPSHAASFSVLNSPEEHREFMVANKYSRAADASEVTEKELSDFREDSVPVLEDFRKNQRTFEAWKEHMTADENLSKNLLENLGTPDVVFVLLGVATAYSICRFRRNRPRTRSQRRRRR